MTQAEASFNNAYIPQALEPLEEPQVMGRAEAIDDVGEFTPVDEHANRHKRIAAAALAGAVIVGGAAALGFEQSPLNEMVRTAAALSVLRHTHDDVDAAAVVGAITFGFEMTTSSLISTAINLKQGTPGWFKRMVNNKKRYKKSVEKDALVAQELIVDKSKDETSAELVTAEGSQDERSHKIQRCLKKGSNVIGGLLTDAGLALGLGAGIVTLRHHRLDDDPTLKNDLLTSAEATAVISSVSAGVAYLATGGVVWANQHGLAPEARWFIKYATDSKVWLGLVGVVYGGLGMRKLSQKLFGKEDKDVVEATVIDTNVTFQEETQ